MKRYIIVLLAAAAVASCNIRRKDRVADEIGLRQEKLDKEADKQRRQFESDSLKKIEALLMDSTTVQLLDSVYNFGNQKAGTKVEHSFRFKNTGNKPLIITYAHASCGCTVPEKPEKPIMPGEIGQMKVVFNTQGKEGHQEKTITVNSNARPAFGELKITGELQTQ